MQRYVRQGTGKTRTRATDRQPTVGNSTSTEQKNRLQAQLGGLAMRGKRKRLLRRLITSAADIRSR